MVFPSDAEPPPSMRAQAQTQAQALTSSYSRTHTDAHYWLGSSCFIAKAVPRHALLAGIYGQTSDRAVQKWTSQSFKLVPLESLIECNLSILLPPPL